MKTSSTPTYTLRATDTQRVSKGNRFKYELVREDGTVASTRNSDRRYIARLVHDNVFFGRLSLIKDGDHAKLIKAAISNNDERRLKELNEVAYLDKDSVAMFESLDNQE